MEYRMISADDHIDLGYLPRDLWTTRLSGSLKERAPHVEDRPCNRAMIPSTVSEKTNSVMTTVPQKKEPRG